MSSQDIPSWSITATESLGLLYRQLQPIEIYVEDSNSEAFYLELVNRIIGEPGKVLKVIPLHGRNHVVKFCESYTDNSPALFLIDGDLDLLCGKREVGKTNLYQLHAYCIENYLFCLRAATELVAEASGVILREHAISHEEWRDFLAPIEQNLKDLFIVFATARIVMPELKTVGHGLAAIMTQRTRKSGPTLDIEKIDALAMSVSQSCIEEVGADLWTEQLAYVSAFSSNLHPLDIVSGKDFLLPLLDHFMRVKGCGSMSSQSLMFKLAKYCSLSRLQGLSDALHVVMSGRKLTS